MDAVEGLVCRGTSKGCKARQPRGKEIGKTSQATRLPSIQTQAHMFESPTRRKHLHRAPVRAPTQTIRTWRKGASKNEISQAYRGEADLTAYRQFVRRRPSLSLVIFDGRDRKRTAIWVRIVRLKGGEGRKRGRVEKDIKGGQETICKRLDMAEPWSKPA